MRFLIVFCLISAQMAAQSGFQRFPVELFGLDGQLLPSGFAGGLSSPQLSEADLNADGKKEIVLFDRIGNKLMAFEKQANGPASQFGYVFAPELLRFFPDTLRDWILLRDLNGDGAADLFCSAVLSNNSVEAYKGYFQGGFLHFQKMRLGNGQSSSPNILYYKDDQTANVLNIVVSRDDYPAIDDINGDGDLDFVTFNPGGGYVEYFENRALENGLGKDTMVLRMADRCFGKIYETGLFKALNLSPSPTICAVPFAAQPLPVHPGSTNLTLDIDGDGDKELVLGDISFTNLVMAKNCGSITNFWACEQDTAFPKYDVPVDINVFPATFLGDIDGDGKRDLFVAPNRGNAGGADLAFWHYKNTATAPGAHHFSLQSKNLFIRDMLDLGTGAHPALADVDGDGLTDIVIGNFGIALGYANYRPKLVYLRNIGTQTAPKFKVEDENWLDFAQFELLQTVKNFSPAFGDLDLDGDLDLLVGDDNGQFFFCENLKPYGDPMQFGPIQQQWKNLYVGKGATPFIVDLDGDGKNDIVAGERNGNLNFFKNKTASQGSPMAFDADPNNASLGKISTASSPGSEAYCAPTFFRFSTGELQMLVGTNDPGRLRRYRNVEQTAPNTAFELVSADFGRCREGFRQHPAMEDLDRDGIFELVVGNLSGGVSILKTDLKTDGSSVSATAEPNEQPASLSMQLFPNPTDGLLQLQLGEPIKGSWRVFDLLGREAMSGAFSNGAASLDLSAIGEGIFWLEARAEGRRAVQKIVVR